MKTKICTKCGEAKQQSMFYLRPVKRKTGGIYYYRIARCFDCIRKEKMLDYNKNSEKRKETSKIYKANNKKRVSEYNKEYHATRKNDPIYLNKIKLKCARYWKENKNSINRWQKEHYELNRESILNKMKYYAKKNKAKIKNMGKNQRDKLIDNYVIGRLKSHAVFDGQKVTAKEIRQIPGLIESHREILKLKRAIKNHGKN